MSHRTLAQLVLTVALATAGCSGVAAPSTMSTQGAPGGSGLPLASPTEFSTSSPSPSPSLAGANPSPGCEPSSLGALKDEGFVPIGGQFTPPEHELARGYDVVASLAQAPVTAYQPILPKAVPGGRSLMLLLANGETQSLFAAYSDKPLQRTDTDTVLMAGRGIAVSEYPFEGQDGPFVLERVKRNRWPVQIGPHPGALVWADEIATGVRPFGVYWADGVRQWIIRGNPVHPDELVDVARSIYC